MNSGWQRAGDAGCLWLAQGMWVGRIPVAPGTFGSVLGLAWLGLLLAPGNPWFFFIGCGLGVAVSVRLCGRAEQIASQKDPSSVVLDEIVAVPICFIPWIVSEWARAGAIPEAGYFFSRQQIWATLVVFVLFRIFDIVKPWPVKQSQRLHQGWGVVVDDVLAALYVALMTLVLVV